MLPSRTRRARRVLAATLAITAASVSTGVGVTRAAAAGDDATVNSIGGLQSVAGGCAGTGADPTVITMSGDISAASDTVAVACHAVIDLAGHTLTVLNVVINSAQALTVDDTGVGGTLTADTGAIPNTMPGIRTTGATLIINGGTVKATGSSTAAGIGGAGGGFRDGGTTTINGGTVTAIGGQNGAGIGGGNFSAGGTTTINGGTVNALGGKQAAGIGGGGPIGPGGTTTITAGTVTATGGAGAAGIGGSDQGEGGTTTISGGTVTATSGGLGAAIGGGWTKGGGTTTISGGTVDAIGGGFGTGIGGGWGGNGGVITIDGGSVTATGANAVGGGSGAPSFGTLAVNGGVLHLPSGAVQVPDSNVGAEITVGPGGVIDGSTGPGTTYGTMAGGGQIINGGRILLPSANVLGGGVTVSDRHYVVTFDTQGGSAAPGSRTVFADTIDHGGRTFPADPTKAGLNFAGWNTAADGSGAPLTASSVLPGTSVGGTPVQITAYAQWGTAPHISMITPSTGPTTGGTSVTITGTGFTGATAVDFGLTGPATSYHVDSDTQITATSPASPDPRIRHIVVTTAGGSSAPVPADRFTYTAPAPTITAITPSSGPLAGGTQVVITGTGFRGAVKVKFGVAGFAVFTVDSATQITATSPTSASAAVRNIRVRTPAGTSPAVRADRFTYTDGQRRHR
ncbi:IPT/TIG domain-containing protein [Nocardioides sp. MH1]|uniref:IPT/TIG domain-containing protein n=1 Tax=Nocardioides sp. MH1 TaxID=3242490 RepID=UPI003521090B